MNDDAFLRGVAVGFPEGDTQDKLFDIADRLQRKTSEEVERYRNGNTALIEALMDMVHQYFRNSPDGIVNHSFISAEEGAIEVLVQAGMAEEVPGKGYRLLWDKLEARKPKPQTWEEAVKECVTDPSEQARLLALADEPALASSRIAGQEKKENDHG